MAKVKQHLDRWGYPVSPVDEIMRRAGEGAGEQEPLPDPSRSTGAHPVRSMLSVFALVALMVGALILLGGCAPSVAVADEDTVIDLIERECAKPSRVDDMISANDFAHAEEIGIFLVLCYNHDTYNFRHRPVEGPGGEPMEQIILHGYLRRIEPI